MSDGFKRSDRAERGQSEGTASDRDELMIIAPRVRNDTSRDRWWRESSFELHRGRNMSEEPIDTIPAELLDELFKR